MGKRSTSRRLAMQALYQADIAHLDISQAVDNVLEQEKMIKATRDLTRDLAAGAFVETPELDKSIKKYSREWKLERIGVVDRSILRLALYELKQKQNPHQVVIDEAVELAKKYSSPEAAKFINGILGSFIKDQA